MSNSLALILLYVVGALFVLLGICMTMLVISEDISAKGQKICLIILIAYIVAAIILGIILIPKWMATIPWN